jgi:PadR family transcriptional regulator, regulatory protein PadR
MADQDRGARAYLTASWERQSIAQTEQRPPRKYYEVTKPGHAALAEARERFRLLSQFEPVDTKKPLRQKG